MVPIEFLIGWVIGAIMGSIAGLLIKITNHSQSITRGDYESGNSYRGHLGKMFCPKCGKETDTDGKFCQWCGTDTTIKIEYSNKKLICPKCSKETDVEGMFCQWCGSNTKIHKK